jgi:hypothetical protein
MDAAEVATAMKDQLIVEAKLLEEAVRRCSISPTRARSRGPRSPRGQIPVIGTGRRPVLDGRVRSVVAAIGYFATAVDDTTPRYANVAEIALTPSRRSAKMRAARQIRGLEALIPNSSGWPFIRPCAVRLMRAVPRHP